MHELTSDQARELADSIDLDANPELNPIVQALYEAAENESGIQLTISAI